MIKRFIKDNRGQVLYAVIVAIMFIGLLSMTAMGLTLKNYQASLQKQQRVSDYYAADAVAELIRIGKIEVSGDTVLIDAKTLTPSNDGTIVVTKVATQDDDGAYQIQTDTVTLIIALKTITENETQKTIFTRWEVSYHAVQTEGK